MPTVSKKAGEQFILTGTVKNSGDVTVNLGLRVVLRSGMATYDLSIKDIGNLAPAQQYPLYYVEKVPSNAPAGTYDVLVSCIDRTANVEFQKIDTLWDIIVALPTKKIELLSVSVS